MCTLRSKKRFLWASSGIRYKTHVVEICHSAVQKDKTCWVPYASPVQCQKSAGPACWRKEREAFEDAVAASQCWAAGCALSEGWVAANHCPPFLPLFLLCLPGWPKASTARPVMTVHGLKASYSGFDSFCSVQLCDNLCGPDVAWLSVLDFPVRCSLSVIMYWLHKEHLNFLHHKLCQNCCKWQWLYTLLPEEVLGVLSAFISCFFMSCLHLSSFMCCLVNCFSSRWPNFQLDESA